MSAPQVESGVILSGAIKKGASQAKRLLPEVVDLRVIGAEYDRSGGLRLGGLRGFHLAHDIYSVSALGASPSAQKIHHSAAEQKQVNSQWAADPPRSSWIGSRRLIAKPGWKLSRPIFIKPDNSSPIRILRAFVCLDRPRVCRKLLAASIIELCTLLK